MNVVVICSDTFRYDHLGFLGKQPVQTPNLDKLASESAAFPDFWLCSFPTLLNRIEVFTGRCTFPLFNWGPLPYQFPVLAEVFKRHGFTTALLADTLHMMNDGWGYGRGFDFVRDVPGQMHDKFQPKSTPMVDLPCPIEKLGATRRRLDRYRRNAYWYRQRDSNTTATLFQAAMEWLDQPRDKFFMWIDAFDPHEPWDAPAEFLKPYPWNKNGDAVFWPKAGYANEYPAADIENMRSLYRAEVTQTDHWIGAFLSQLRGKGLLDNTAVIFTSDHGTYFGEHGLLGKPVKMGKLGAIYEELGHLPLLLRHPEGLAAGKCIGGIGQPQDLFATALDLAGIPRVLWAQGNSLVPRLRGEPSPQKFAVGGYFPHKGRVNCISVWTEEWALMHSPTEGFAEAELYHVPTDPTHTRNVIAENRAVAQQLFDRLGGWLDELGVPPARKQQLLNNAPFSRWDKLKYSLWLSKNHFSYWKKYRHYDRGAYSA
jgi:arylsulfatase A-like enzyme